MLGSQILKIKKALKPYCPDDPTEAQLAFLLLDHREVLYGGQAGGGKSNALLMKALLPVEIPGYAGLLLRRTYADLSLPGALMDRAADWLMPTAATWNNSTKTWTFPSGATLSFGYLETEKSKYRYAGSEFQYIGFDELTQFPESAYRFLFSRLRRTNDIPVELAMRAGSNPGGEGHAWVYERFIVGAAENAKKGRLFLPAGLRDNPHVDPVEYTKSLEELDDVTKAQLLDGLWITDPHRRPFDPEWWRNKNRYYPDHFRVSKDIVARWCSWDTAYEDGETNDYSACSVVELTSDYRLLLKEVYREKLTFPYLPNAIEEMAYRQNHDGKLRGVIIEDKGSGTSAFQTLQKTMSEVYGNLLVAFKPTTSKLQRAKQTATWAKRDCIWFPYPSGEVDWLYEFEQEFFPFPDATFDDQVDSLTQVVIFLENLISAGWHSRNGGSVG